MAHYIQEMTEELARHLRELHGGCCDACGGPGFVWPGHEYEEFGDAPEDEKRPCPACGGRGRTGGMAEAMRVLAKSVDDFEAQAAPGVDCGVCGWVFDDVETSHAEAQPNCPAVVLARLRETAEFTPLPDGT